MIVACYSTGTCKYRIIKFFTVTALFVPGFTVLYLTVMIMKMTPKTSSSLIAVLESSQFVTVVSTLSREAGLATQTAGTSVERRAGIN